MSPNETEPSAKPSTPNFYESYVALLEAKAVAPAAVVLAAKLYAAFA